MNARQLRHAVAASDALRALHADLATDGHELLASVVHSCGEAILAVTGLIVRGHVEVPRAVDEREVVS